MSNKKNIIIILIIYNERISQPKKAQKQNWDGTLVTTTAILKYSYVLYLLFNYLE